MTRKKDQRASMLARCLRRFGWLDGIPLVEDGRLWLVGRPAGRPADAAGLAGLLLRPGGPGVRELAAALGVGDPYAADKESLVHRAFEVKTLETARDLERLRQEGYRPLRPFHREDLTKHVATAREHLDRLSMLLSALEAGRACQRPDLEQEPPVKVLVAALPLRLHALGTWEADPARLLLAPDLRAGRPLAELAALHPGAPVGVLAALLLGLRQRRSPPAGQDRTRARLPATLRAPFQAGLRGLAMGPCLTALAWDRSTPEVEGLEVLPRQDRERLVALADAVAVIYGPDEGLGVLGDLSTPQRQRETTLAAGLDHALGFAEQVERWKTADSPNAGSLATELDRLPPRPASARGRGLARLFFSWMEKAQGLRPCPSVHPLARAATRGLLEGIVGAAEALVRHWEDHQQKHEAPSEDDLRVRLAASLCLVGTGVELPGHVSRDWLEALVKDTQQLSPERLAEVASELVPRRSAGDLEAAVTLATTDLPLPLVRRALTLGVEVEAATFSGKPRALGKYLDFLEAAQRGGLELDLLRYLGVHGFFLSDAPGFPQVALTVISRIRGGAGHMEVVTSLEALARGLRGHSSVLEQALARWHTPVVEKLPDRARSLARLLDVPLARLEAYLHHRRINGLGETFSRRLLAPLEQEQAEQRQALHLEHTLADPTLGQKKRETFTRRLAGLQDPVRLARRRSAAARRAQRRLARDLAEMEHGSLGLVMDTAARQLMEQLLEKKLPDRPLHPELWKVIQLLSEGLHQPDRALVLALLEQIACGASPASLPENQRWLEDAGAAGVDVDTWTRGFSATVELNGEPIRFATEDDPVEALKMGSYFSTCLSLEDGINRATAVINTLDVNKHVVYGRREDGAVVARKLIGATASGELAGYRTYVMAFPYEDMLHCLAEPLMEFGRRCGLTPDNTTEPEVLHGERWYDDGNEPWPGLRSHSQMGLTDVRGLLEREMRDALLTGGWRSLVRYIPFFFPSLVYHLTVRYPPQGVNDIGYLCGEDMINSLAQWSEFEWLPHAFICTKLPMCPNIDGGSLLSMAPLRLSVLRPMTGAIRSLNSPSPCRCTDSDYPPDHSCALEAHACLSLLPLSELATLFRDLSGRPQRHSPSLALCLLIAYLRDGQSTPLCTGLEKGPQPLRDAVLEIASMMVVPGVEKPLRRLLKQAQPADQLQIALALGKQRKVQDAWKLLKVLRHHPTSLELTAMVANHGDPHMAGEAQNLWRPPSDLLGLLRSRRELSRARDLDLPQLADHIMLLYQRALDRNKLTAELTEVMAGLALPATRSELERLLDQVYRKSDLVGPPKLYWQTAKSDKEKFREKLIDKWEYAHQKKAEAIQNGEKERERLLDVAARDKGLEGVSHLSTISCSVLARSR